MHNPKSSEIAHYCDKCHIYQPLKCYHCKYCENCVLEFESHCFLMATCIGKRNIKHLLGLVTATGVALYLLLGTLTYRGMNDV